MSFYHFQEDMGIFLKNTIYKLIDNKRDSLLQDISLTWINYPNNEMHTKGFGCGFNNYMNIYPASIVKLVYGLAVYKWIEEDKLIFDNCIEEAVYKMLHDSSNDATSFVLDVLTGTCSGLSIEGETWANWKYQRQIINDWLKSLNWIELKDFNCCQKTWEDSPYGREKDFYGKNNENTNLMSTKGTGRIFEEIMKNTTYNKENVNLKNYLSRGLNKASYKLNPNNQIEGFLGEGLPDCLPYWSKAGLMSKVRHDAAWWTNNDSSHTLLIVFGNSAEFVQDKSIFPLIAKTIYEYKQI